MASCVTFKTYYIYFQEHDIGCNESVGAHMWLFMRYGGCAPFPSSEWIHTAPHCCSLWQHQRRYPFAEPRGCCGLHGQGESTLPSAAWERHATHWHQHKQPLHTDWVFNTFYLVDLYQWIFKSLMIHGTIFYCMPSLSKNVIDLTSYTVNSLCFTAFI